MARTTVQDIRSWLERGKEKNVTHVAVFTDTFDWTDYPVYIKASNAQDAKDQVTNKITFDGHNLGERLMEVYRLDMDWNEQLSSYRSVNY